MLQDSKRSTWALLALAISAFAIGTTEFISVGLLPLIAEDLGISVTTAGLTVTLYALGVTFGAPVLTSLTSTISRKALLLAIMNVPGLQMYVVTLAERYAPQAKDVASAFNIAAFNAGIAIGAYLGGVINDSIGLIHTTWVGALMVLVAVILTAWAKMLESKDQHASVEMEKASC